jgi:hypothetical protein
MKGEIMKKLLLVLLAVALAAFLVVGCIPGTVTPVTPVTGIDCPTTVKVSGEVLIAGKNYIQGGKEKTITVTFAVPTAPVSVYVGYDISKAGGLVPDDADEVVMYTTDNKVYTGTYTFVDSGCEADYIYVETCGACAACKYPYTVDGDAPEIELEICGKLASCPGCALSFSSTIGGTCAPVEHCYDCSGLASWTIDLYDLFPDFLECGCIPCVKPIETGTGTACPVSWKSAYAEKIEDEAWAVVTLVDKVGNSTKFGYYIVLGDSCDIISITPMDPVEDCLDAAPDAVECGPCVN